jgi:hypothetical protein
MRFNLDNYETVETRLAKFWAQFPNGQVFTQIHHYDDNKVVFRAEIFKDISDPRPVATGYAEEVRDLSPVNKTSHVENAETSSIGRALSNYIFQSKTAPRPSREEMSKVVRAQEAPKPTPKVGPDLVTKFREACAKQGFDPQEVAREAQVDLTNLTDADMPKLRDKFNQLKQAPTATDVENADKFIDKIRDASKTLSAPKPLFASAEKEQAFLEQIQEVFPTAAKVAETPQIKNPDEPASAGQVGKIRAMLSGKGFGSYTDKIEKVQDMLNKPDLKKIEHLTKGDASLVINMIEEMK